MRVGPMWRCHQKYCVSGQPSSNTKRALHKMELEPSRSSDIGASRASITALPRSSPSDPSAPQQDQRAGSQGGILDGCRDVPVPAARAGADGGASGDRQQQRRNSPGAEKGFVGAPT